MKISAFQATSPNTSPYFGRQLPKQPQFGSVITVRALCENKHPAEVLRKHDSFGFFDPRGWWPFSEFIKPSAQLVDSFRIQAPRQLVQGFNLVDAIGNMSEKEQEEPNIQTQMNLTAQMSGVTNLVGESIQHIAGIKQVLASQDQDFAQTNLAIADTRSTIPSFFERLFSSKKPVEFNLLTGQTAISAAEHYSKHRNLNGFKLPKPIGHMTVNYEYAPALNAIPAEVSEVVFMPKEAKYQKR